MLQSRTNQGSLTYTGKFYVFGEYTDKFSPRIKQVLNCVECYCPSTDEWHAMPPMLQPRKDPRGVVAIGENFYIVDGIDYHRMAR